MRDEILYKRKKLVQMASDDIIGEHGSQWLSACEISDTLNLSDEAMFSHFIGINDLHISVFEHFPKFHCDICLLSTFTVFHPRDSIIHFITDCTEYYVTYSGIMSIMRKVDKLQYALKLEVKIVSIVKSRGNAILQLAKAA